MSNQGGDRKFGHGDNSTRTAASAVEGGHWVVPTTDSNVDLSDASGAGGSLVGVVSEDAASGETVTTHYRGIVKARVESSVAAGNELAAPDSGATSGATTPGVAGAGGSSGVFALRDAWQASDGNYYTYALMR